MILASITQNRRNISINNPIEIRHYCSRDKRSRNILPCVRRCWREETENGSARLDRRRRVFERRRRVFDSDGESSNDDCEALKADDGGCEASIPFWGFKRREGKNHPINQ
ncbi:unnamed protein product [Linum trigynum]|uniref:Uncharacterized protein n=1 Tax=Linum trigynum TaxID=586398 RepID=A0AAV2FQD9_9ROSI